jgi:pyruvate dehydrogenase E1 component beta subunit
MFCNAPGLQVVAPGTPADARGLMRTAALHSNNPTVFIDHGRLQGVKGEVDKAAAPVPFGVAEVKRKGTDVTIVAVSIMVPRALDAAEALAREGISAEVVDPRTLVPLDKATILKSVAKTGRVVLADESQLNCGVAAELAAVIAEEGFAFLKAPIRRVGIPNVPVPYHQAEEDFITPTAAKIVAAARSVCGK